MAETEPLQLYSSALVFCPRCSITREIFNNKLSNWLQLPWVEKAWSAELQTLEAHSSCVRSVAFSPDGLLLASGSYDKTLKLWDPSTGELRQTLKGHSSCVGSVAFTPDSRLLASGSDDKTVKLWDPSTGELRQTLKGHSSPVHSVAFSPDGRLLASGSDDKTVKLWDTSTGELRQTLSGHFGAVYSVTFSPDGRLLASGSKNKASSMPLDLMLHDKTVKLRDSSSNDETVMLWDSSTGELRQILKGHSHWIWTEKGVVVSIEDHQWICFQRQRILWLPTDYRLVCLANNGSVLALGHRRGRVSFISYDDNLLGLLKVPCSGVIKGEEGRRDL
jgi:predicted NACHT family NTPase